jgi:hypothetical protein
MLLMATAFAAGCDSKPKGMPELAPVSGTVTMDGQPLANVLVVLRSQQGAVSMSVTDEHGRYQSKYLSRFAGAGLGKTAVEISGLPTSAEDPTPSVTVPPQYNTQTKLTVDVQKGTNTFDFPLTSK